jgi:hypothetical protein
VSDEQQQKPDNVDRIDFRLPLGMGFSVSGRNASKLFWAVGMTAIIIALGWAIANVIGAFNGNSTGISGTVGWNRRCQHQADLPRWSDSAVSQNGATLSDAVSSDRRDFAVFG